MEFTSKSYTHWRANQKAVILHLYQLKPLFAPEVKLTLIARLPGDPEADIIFTADDLSAVGELIEHQLAREKEKS